MKENRRGRFRDTVVILPGAGREAEEEAMAR